jgi:hypothetical protein
MVKNFNVKFVKLGKIVKKMLTLKLLELLEHKIFLSNGIVVGGWTAR